MSSIPHLITAHSKSDSWLFDASDEEAEGMNALRDACEAAVLEEEIFYHYGELPQRMQAALIKALKAGDTEANDREVGRIMRAAFNRAVNDALEMRIDRIKAEAMIGERDD
ncbi:hypothetical protein [Paraburkholderia sp. HD33-4]|uniref:hypothetical protein n=1 Tax=Paraburkholderia sp. HD33-4 TaxID=2883242 RepID=UPI001F2DEE65|nr:hypothetical protein [Paraburkholderia sp. HD33-4]